MRVGLYGGSFDPPHAGHLILAERCREEANLDEVWFVPSYKPPHKDADKLGKWDHRLDMLALATAGHAPFRVEPIERELPPPTYTVQTIAELRRRHPDAEFVLVVGADSVRDLPTWHEPARLVREVEIAVVPRPDVESWDAARLGQELGVPAGEIRLTQVPMPLIELASHEVRTRLRAGKGIRYLVPRAVEEYIREKNVYG